jgi:light-independent protochlorophyllide reductase subunit B
MKLTLWTYEGPPHVGAMRVATAMKGLHYVLHAPQGDTYADLLFTMIERRDHRPPVTYTTFQARDLGADTAGLFKQTCQAAYERFRPEAIIVGASCTAELIQDDPGGLAASLGLPVPVIPLELPSYQRKENFGADETFLQICRALARPVARTAQPSCNILGPTALGFRHRDDVAEISRLLAELGVTVNLVAPLGARPADIARLGAAWFNVLLYPETAESAARWAEREFRQPFTRTIPYGTRATRAFLDEVRGLAGLATRADEGRLRQPWWSASVDSTYLTGKRVFVFGDATHAMAAARVARDEIGFEVVGLGAYNREFARPVRALAREFGLEALITDDYLEVEAAIAAAAPELILGTQMERHIGKRLGIPCAVISAPVHVQDFPARYSPVMGFEGANVLFDTWVHPLVMGLEEHLLTMFRDDFEFHDSAGPSHHGGHAPRAAGPEPAGASAAAAPAAGAGGGGAPPPPRVATLGARLQAPEPSIPQRDHIPRVEADLDGGTGGGRRRLGPVEGVERDDRARHPRPHPDDRAQELHVLDGRGQAGVAALGPQPHRLGAQGQRHGIAGRPGQRPAQRHLGPRQRHPARSRVAQDTLDHVQMAHETRHEPGGGAVVDVEGRAHLLGHAAVHHHDPVRDRQRLFLIVGHEDGGDPQPLLDRPDLGAQRHADLGVQRAQRLVQQQHLRAGGERARQRHPLLLPARELVGIAPAQIGQADQRQHLGHPRLGLRPRHARHLQPETHVLRHRQVGEQRIGLEHHADLALVGTQAGNLAPVDADRPGIGPLEPRDHAQHGRLAAARGAQQRDELALLDPEGEILDHPNGAEGLFQMRKLEEGHQRSPW